MVVELAWSNNNLILDDWGNFRNLERDGNMAPSWKKKSLAPRELSNYRLVSNTPFGDNDLECANGLATPGFISTWCQVAVGWKQPWRMTLGSILRGEVSLC